MKKILAYIFLAFFVGFGIGSCVNMAFAETTTIKYDGQPVPSAMAPSFSGMNPKMCRTGVSGAANTGVFSVSGGASAISTEGQGAGARVRVSYESRAHQQPIEVSAARIEYITGIQSGVNV